MGTREENRRQTLKRITQSAMSLFAKQGYEATTLDAIAAAAGISRRTFFHYFKSKDDILLSQQAGLGEQLIEALAAEPTCGTPTETLQAAMRRIAASYPLEELITIDKLMMSIEAVQARKQANYIRDEHLLLEALRQRWPEESDMSLRLAAQMAIGLTRLSLDAWRSEGGTKPIVDYLDLAIAELRQEFGGS
ncbi:helix-turn-helix domain-containing protein [Devosia sp. XK-2]|uniref:TetR/AcrR family transcriptional regulator n=1 Tax=Devosia sp. XK-2 TaxID=3126689 RepID=UPI0030CEAB01